MVSAVASPLGGGAGHAGAGASPIWGQQALRRFVDQLEKPHGTHDWLDPAFHAHVATIGFLATAWWEGWRPSHDLDQAHEDGMKRVKNPL